MIFGRSLGGSVATWLAAQHPSAALIIESTPTSIPDMGARVYPFLPVRLLARIHYNALELIGEVEAPVLVVHSRDDELIPFEHGQKLFEAAREPKTFLPIRGDHNAGFLISGKDYMLGLRDFLAPLTASDPIQPQGEAGERHDTQQL